MAAEAALTLTGATLTSDGSSQIELSSSSSLQQKTTSTSLAHNHKHCDRHSHNGDGSSHRPCCSSPTPLYSPPTKTMPSVEQVLTTWEPSQIFKRLSEIVRMGSYDDDDFEPIFVGLLQKPQQKPHDSKEESISAYVIDHVGNQPSLLHWAAKRVDDKRFLMTLCQHVSSNVINTAVTDEVGMFPIHWACTVGSVPYVATLLKYGAQLECSDCSGCTPLLLAAQYGHVDLVAFLLQRGANGQAVDKSHDNALHWAAYKGSIQVCGLLKFRGELSWTTTDKYGQTPLHLASLRGHTTVVRYLLQEYGTKQERRQLLFLRDENGNTPLDLAINRKRPNVQALLRDAMEEVEHRRNICRQVKSGLRQLCSLHSWQVWMGIHGMNDEVDESPKFPFYFMLGHILVATLWYPLVFLPIGNTSRGVLWDLMGWNFFNMASLTALWLCVYKVYTTDPGTLNEYHPQTAELRRIYEQTLESYSDEESFARHKTPLCHTCHIAKPLRSKHCRVARRCVLLFDHHCPFVGNTIGLNNYRWFYLTLFFMTLSVVDFVISLSIYVHRQPTMEWGMLCGGIYIGLFIIPCGGMFIYHTQLMLANLTTNEHQNVARYKYLFNEQGQYKNLFFRGYLHNFLDRLSPTEASYTLVDNDAGLEERPLFGSNTGRSRGDDVI